MDGVHGILVQVLRETVSRPVAEAYAALIVEGQREARLGVEGSLDQELMQRGLAYPVARHDPPLIAATDPLTAMTAMLGHLQKDLAVRQEHLMRGFVAMVDLQREVDLQRRDSDPSALVQVLTEQSRITALSYTLITDVQYSYMSINTLNFDIPLAAVTNVLPPRLAVDQGVRFRELYSADYLAHQVGLEMVRASMTGGAEVRTAPDLPIKLIIADEHSALVALTIAGSGSALLVRSRVLIAALCQYFELLWNLATPVATQHSAANPLAGREQEVLTLLAHGLKDDAIARRLGLSLRTVRRHVATIMDKLNATTRFAAGAAAHRQGLLD